MGAIVARLGVSRANETRKARRLRAGAGNKKTPALARRGL
jgi:hypothetical protein